MTLLAFAQILFTNSESAVRIKGLNTTKNIGFQVEEEYGIKAKKSASLYRLTLVKNSEQ
jgi:hypothetical protein